MMSTENKKDCDLSNVVLQVNGENIQEQASSRLQRRPKRVLHFSDGDLVEYSDDDEADTPKTSPQQALIDLKTLGWIPWTWYQTIWFSSKLLEGCDYVGEALADFLGITSPKYQFEIDEYNRMQKLQAEERQREEQEMESWNVQHNNTLIMNDVKASE